MAIFFNVGLLFYYKYVDFFSGTVNVLFRTDLPILNLALPLAISFFTFQQIAFLVDAYNKEIKKPDFLNYCLFISFFPQLIAGPIVHHKEMMPQFDVLKNKFINHKNIALGIFIFSIGLFKKVILADRLAIWVNRGYNELDVLSLTEGWLVSLSYSFQLYFDFSGYMDMAMGAALMLNITLPINFNSPYKATNIQDTWSRWHITLSRFLYRYIYKPLNRFLLKRVFRPLGLARYITLRTCTTLILLFLISGFWHGAGWTFVLWGLMHGIATVIHRFWKQSGRQMNKLLGWAITFNFLNFSLVFFRARDFSEATKVLKGMFGLNGVILPPYAEQYIPEVLREWIDFMPSPLSGGTTTVKYIILSLIIILGFKNSVQLLEKFKPKWYILLFTLMILVYSILNVTSESEFLYFNF